MQQPGESPASRLSMAALLRYDHLLPVEAVVAAWTASGRLPNQRKIAQHAVRDIMPVLARALNRLADEYGRPPPE